MRHTRQSFVPAVALAALLVSCGTSRQGAGAPPSLSFRGLYTATGGGPIGDLAIADDGAYVLRPSGCYVDACLESGTAVFDASAKVLALDPRNGGPSRRMRVDVLEATQESTLAARITPSHDTGGSGGVPLTGGDGGASLVDEAGVALGADAGATLVSDGGALLAGDVSSALLDGQPVQLWRGGAGGTASNGNATSAPWPGVIPGVAPLRTVVGQEVTTDQPSGNAVTVAAPNDGAFSADSTIAQRYEGTANIYNSHGFPGGLVGGIPESDVRDYLNGSSLPLVVASCFGGASLTGGSTIRRLVSAYADDPSTASRVYGCTGFAASTASAGLVCSGTWVDANQQAVPDSERQRLQLHQVNCSTNTYGPDGQPIFSDCQGVPN